MNEQFEARGDSQERPLSISQLNWYIKNLLENSLPSLWAEGEVSDVSRPHSGHIYFSLKDDRSQVRAVIWRSTAERLKFKLKDGMSVICKGAVEVYPPRGSYQLIVNSVQPQGIGPLQMALSQLHKKLAAEGLFEQERKKPLPPFPRRIGFVTSPSGAALHDFLEAAKTRWPDFELLIIPARVQGEFATREIVAGIKRAQDLQPELDLLVVGRGGGSMEDLWSFNEEPVVRALADCSLPTISAVGHEIDVTLSDLVADARALTPTQAAQVGLPSADEIAASLDQTSRRLSAMINNRLTAANQRYESIAKSSILARPHDLHMIRRQQIDELELQLSKSIQRNIEKKRETLGGMARAVEALSPLSVLARGYSLTRDAQSGQRIRSIDSLEEGQEVESVLPDGIATSIISAKRPNV
ncbi:MAG: exodeoxyribonuclease VII large subunit [Aureliella sp.]